ncbi:MAG: hypothetical protein SF162_05320 [bacterium]|nr:hypothetical protein [bacterium]
MKPSPFSTTFTFTKRGLGLLLVFGGILGFLAIILIDILDVGRQGGIGPAQRIGLGLCIIIAVIGLSLIPLGSAEV